MFRSVGGAYVRPVPCIGRRPLPTAAMRSGPPDASWRPVYGICDIVFALLPNAEKRFLY